jgi:hypothetical protein
MIKMAGYLGNAVKSLNRKDHFPGWKEGVCLRISEPLNVAIG